jgi:hypothetical protein
LKPAAEATTVRYSNYLPEISLGADVGRSLLMVEIDATPASSWSPFNQSRLA